MQCVLYLQHVSNWTSFLSRARSIATCGWCLRCWKCSSSASVRTGQVMLCANNPTSQLLGASKMDVSLKVHVFCWSAEGSGFRSHSGTQAPSQHMITVNRKETQELSTRCQMLPPASDTHDLDTKASHVTKDGGKCNLITGPGGRQLECPLPNTNVCHIYSAHI